MNVILIFMNIAIHDRQISVVTENNIEDILNPIFVTFIFTRRIQIFVIISEDCVSWNPLAKLCEGKSTPKRTVNVEFRMLWKNIYCEFAKNK